MKKILSLLSAFSLTAAISSSVVSCDYSNKEEQEVDLFDIDFSSLNLTAGNKWDYIKNSINTIIKYNTNKNHIEFQEDWDITNFSSLVDNKDIIRGNIEFQIKIINENISIKGYSKILKTKLFKINTQKKQIDYWCSLSLSEYKEKILSDLRERNSLLWNIDNENLLNSDIEIGIDNNSISNKGVIKNTNFTVRFKKNPLYLEGEINTTFSTKVIDLSDEKGPFFSFKSKHFKDLNSRQLITNFVKQELFFYRYVIQIDIDYEILFNCVPNEDDPNINDLKSITIKAKSDSKFLIGEYTVDYFVDMFELANGANKNNSI
ncbi:hypothetical protein SHELI_v1c04130 [Spiroplasma helicoides]|uniref:Lipoprotein n=1 Tax=Spiroplasma helicoides TaxID=216938 RepID=A0A1B3SKA6_9MOLU|nr:lipoprotein [Spiroplasma helicoides]AOG60364.1 hypothetical protein SHELI_v1c04130 [Spiroplasma helicoides]